VVEQQRFGPLPREQMTEAQLAVAAAICSGPRANTQLSGPFEALLRSPELADRVQSLGAYLRFESSLPRPMLELAILLTARRWSSQFEWYTHARLAAEEAGIDQGIIQAIAELSAPQIEDPQLRGVYTFVSQLLAEGFVDDENFDRVVATVGQSGAIDLIGLVGYYCLVSFVINVDRYPVPGDFPLRARTGEG